MHGTFSFQNGGLYLFDSGDDDLLQVVLGEDMTATRVLTLLVGDGNRVLNITANASISGTNTGDQLVFKTISVSGQSDVVADTITDTLTLIVRPFAGHIAGYQGVDAVQTAFGEWIIDAHLPGPGTPTQPVEAGYMANAWVRMRHPDYDELRRMMDTIGRTVKVRAS